MINKEGINIKLKSFKYWKQIREEELSKQLLKLKKEELGIEKRKKTIMGLELQITMKESQIIGLNNYLEKLDKIETDETVTNNNK